MKKLIIVLLVFVMLFTVACAPEPEVPDFPDFDPETTPEPGPSGTNPSGTVPSEPNYVVVGDKYNDDMYSITITLKEKDGKMVEKSVVKTWRKPITENIPSNSSVYPYVSDFVPTATYELPLAYAQDEQTPKEDLLSIFAEQNATSIEERVVNFIRYIYVLTDGKLLLSVSYDTSAIYQTKSIANTLVTGGYVMRAYIKAEKCTLAQDYTTFNSVFYATAKLVQNNPNEYSYTEWFSKRMFGSYPFVTTPVSQNNLSEGAGYWADVFIGMPLVETNSKIFPFLVDQAPNL
ncbi:MAG: hypothetical protein IKC83_00585 [Clostridia bacterium]|nr:hypothetical protein [Clostridia bacterium]